MNFGSNTHMVNGNDGSFVICPIADIYTNFSEKFGIPRQSGLAPSSGKIIFRDAYRNPDAIKGLSDFSHIWVIWSFSENIEKKKTPTVRPPKLGGNEHIGVFATRSPFRPNNLGLSSLKLESIDYDDPNGPALIVSGVDMLDHTPIFDIKPYIAYADSHSNARGGFTDVINLPEFKIQVPDDIVRKIPFELRDEIYSLLKLNPRPGYQNDPERVYGMSYAGMNISFSVKDDIIKITDVRSL
jgi:tRNA-Thr(GGU) m(6)t(6)A37 methyltransferase TsaA